MSDCSNSVTKYIVVEASQQGGGSFSGLTICGGGGLIVDVISGCTSNGVNIEGGTFNNGVLTIPTINATTFSGGTFYGDGSNLTGISTIDSYMTGGTYSNGFITFSGSGVFSDVVVDVSGLLDDTNTFVTGTTFGSNQAVVTRNDGQDILKLSGGTAVTLSNPSSNLIKIDVDASSDNFYVTGGTVTGTDLILGRSGGLNNVTINATDFFDNTDNYVTGATMVGNTLVLNRTDMLSAATVDLGQFVDTFSDTYVTGFTFNSTTYDLTLGQNNGELPKTVDLSILADDVYVLSGVYNPSTGIVEYTNSSGTTFEVSGFTTGMTDTYTTKAYILSGETIAFDSNLNGTNVYRVDLSPLLSGKTNNSTFTSYTSSTQTILGTKVDGGINVGGGDEVFSGKSGTDFYFRTLSGGSNTTLTTIGDVIRIDTSEHTIDTNGMFDSSNQGGTWAVSGYTLGNHTTTTMNGYNQIYGGAGDFYGSNKDFAISIGSSPDVNSNLYVVSTDRTYSGRFLNNDTDLSGARYVASFESSSTKVGTSTLFGVISNLTGPTTGGTYYAGYFRSAGGNNDYGVAVPNDGGNSGFGTILPTATVQIGENANNGTFRYVDGNQASNRVLITDTNGNATWGDVTSLPGVTGDTNTYVTGFTIDTNQLTLTQNDGTSGFTVDLNPYLDNTDTNYYVTGGTLNDDSIVIGRNDSDNIITITGGTNVTITEPVSGTFRIDSPAGAGADGNSYVTGVTVTNTLTGDTLVTSFNDGLNDIVTDLSITRDITFKAEEFALNSASRVTITPLVLSAVRFAGSGGPGTVRDAGVSFKIPEDYSSNAEFYMIWRSSTTSTTLSAQTNFDVYTGDSTNIGGIVTSVDSFDIIDFPESTANVFIYSDTTTFSSYTPKAGDNVHLRVYRDHANDTLTSNMDLINLVFRYTAIR
jgi:hypothetical protein